MILIIHHDINYTRLPKISIVKNDILSPTYVFLNEIKRMLIDINRYRNRELD